MSGYKGYESANGDTYRQMPSQYANLLNYNSVSIDRLGKLAAAVKLSEPSYALSDPSRMQPLAPTFIPGYSGSSYSTLTGSQLILRDNKGGNCPTGYATANSYVSSGVNGYQSLANAYAS